ncbi:hypothetical protein FQN55_006721 [Onygenales sp. PD_40]|nr:hypothetical protein FQN55_006721 [Onygenales sp. PD_40]
MSVLGEETLIPVACTQQEEPLLPLQLPSPPSDEPSESEEASDPPHRPRRKSSSLFSVFWRSLSYAGEVVNPFRGGTSRAERDEALRIQERKKILDVRLREATTLHEWLVVAGELDKLEGLNEWKATVECDDYNPELVQKRLEQLQAAQASSDVGQMAHLIRTSLSRGLGDITNKYLYNRSRIGTKNLVDQYVTTVAETINKLLEVTKKYDFDGHESRWLLEQILAARKAYGRSALLLSGGATFGMNHIGVVKTLFEVRLLPRIVSGSSAGSIVGSILCVFPDGRIAEILDQVITGTFRVFTGEDDDGKLPVLQRLARFFKQGSFYDIAHLTQVMKDLLGEVTFEEAYNRTRRILNICVSNAGIYELPKLLNHITAPNVLVWSAVVASCSAPLVFTSSPLIAKDPDTGEVVEWQDPLHRWIDGSVDHDLPMERLSEMFNVNHFIVSQVNPHIIPFIPEEETFLLTNVADKEKLESNWTQSIKDLLREEFLHRMHITSELGILPNLMRKLRSIMSQRYYGDITIYPEISYWVLPNMLRNPTAEFMNKARLSGERATWPKLARIRNHCSVELALDSAVGIMRERVVFHRDPAPLPISRVISSVPDPSEVHSQARLHRRSSHGDEPMLNNPESSQASRQRPVHQLRQTKSSTSHESSGFNIGYARVPGHQISALEMRVLESSKQKYQRMNTYITFPPDVEDGRGFMFPNSLHGPEPISPDEPPYVNMSEWANKTSPIHSRRSSLGQILTTPSSLTSAGSTDAVTAVPVPVLLMSPSTTTHPKDKYRRAFPDTADSN